MNIGTAARLSGIPTKTIRYYEGVGLIPRAGRSEAGYRRYGDTDVAALRFIQRARGLGFSVKDVANLLALWRDRGRASSEVKKLALGHVAEIERKIAELQSIRQTLVALTLDCHGDDGPDCPILDGLASNKK